MRHTKLVVNEELTGNLLAAWSAREKAYMEIFANAYSPGEVLDEMRRKFLKQGIAADQQVFNILERIIAQHRQDVEEAEANQAHAGVSAQCVRCGQRIKYVDITKEQPQPGYLPNSRGGAEIYEKTGMCFICHNQSKRDRNRSNPMAKGLRGR